MGAYYRIVLKIEEYNEHELLQGDCCSYSIVDKETMMKVKDTTIEKLFMVHVKKILHECMQYIDPIEYIFGRRV